MTLIWYVDSTKKGSKPDKWRDDTHWERYSERNQTALNLAFQEGTSQLCIMKEKWQCEVLVDLDKLEQYDDEKTVRYMKCHYSIGNLCKSWEEQNPRTRRESFNTLSSYLYHEELSTRLQLEYFDPSALQAGDAYEDALLRGVDEGTTITKCRLTHGGTSARIKVNWYATPKKVQLRKDENVVLTLLEEDAEREDLEFKIIEMAVKDRSMVIELDVAEYGKSLEEAEQSVKVLCENLRQYRIDRSSEKAILRTLLHALWKFTTRPTLFRRLIVDNELNEKAKNVRSITEEQREVFVKAMQAEKLDVSQQGAIEKALMSHFCVIHGPPGTGKTCTPGSFARSS